MELARFDQSRVCKSAGLDLISTTCSKFRELIITKIQLTDGLSDSAKSFEEHRRSLGY